MVLKFGYKDNIIGRPKQTIGTLPKIKQKS